MPELPDVEVFRRYLDSTALQKRIMNVELFSHRILEGVSGKRLKSALEGATLKDTARHGKYLFARLDKGQELVLHFGMTGFLKYYKNDDSGPDHERLRLRQENGYSLAFDNQRLLGRVFLAADRERFIEEQELGPDALSVDFREFAQILGRGRGAIKSTLMNQKMLAGLGNIYTDEILFQARVHPKTSPGSLSEQQLQAVYQQMRAVLEKSIEIQADPERMPKGYLLSHREKDGTCPRCGGPVRKITLSGRATYFCPDCQGGAG
jgi:formamidopyrimidine-DNA glycosylase